MNPLQSIESILPQSWPFSGRARPAEFWWWTLAYLLGCVCVMLSTGRVPSLQLPFGGSLSPAGVLAVVFFLPHVAVTVRRLHDLSFSGWWALGYLVPFGFLGMLMFCALDTGRGPKGFGRDPCSIPVLVAAAPGLVLGRRASSGQWSKLALVAFLVLAVAAVAVAVAFAMPDVLVDEHFGGDFCPLRPFPGSVEPPC